MDIVSVCKIIPQMPVVHGLFGWLCAKLFLIYVTFDSGHIIVCNILFGTIICEAGAPLKVSMLNGCQESFLGWWKESSMIEPMELWCPSQLYMCLLMLLTLWSLCGRYCSVCWDSGGAFPWHWLMVHSTDGLVGLSTLISIWLDNHTIFFKGDHATSITQLRDCQQIVVYVWDAICSGG